ncbi:MAG: helix-turn-helix domain-containing protein [Solirubrobacterales bacterium]
MADETSVSELSRQASLDKSTVSRQLASLESRRLVLRNPNSQKFSLGFKLLELGKRVAARYELASVAEAAMRRLRDETDETISLHLRVGPTDRVCIAQFEKRAACGGPGASARC